MAAAAASLASIQKFGGSSTENWTDFESLSGSLVDVANINADRRVDYLKSQLQDAALQFFPTLDDDTRNDLEVTLTALKDHFCNPNLKEIHHINLENLKFNNKTDSPEEIVVKLQNLALKAYPPPVDLPVEQLNEEVENDQQRFDREHRGKKNRRNFATKERDRHVIRLFKKAMPKFIRPKLLEEPENATIPALCTKTRQTLILRQLCPLDDWSRDGFNEMNNDNTENFLNVITKTSENQTSLETKLNALSEKSNTQQSPNNSGSNYQTNYQNQRGRGNYRGRYNNRGNNYGGISRRRYGNNYRGNNLGRYNCGGNYRGKNPSINNSNYNNYNNNYNNGSFRQNESNETTVTSGKYDGLIKTTGFSQKVCYTCDYPNHTPRNCEVK